MKIDALKNITGHKEELLRKNKLMEEQRQRWAETGLIEGLEKDEASRISMLLENQAKQLISESTQTGNTQGSEEWSGVALPLVRKIFANIAAKQFVSVQPMERPAGLVFYVDYKYGTDKGFVNKGDSVYGNTETATGGLYGAGRFGYSTNEYNKTGLTLTTAASVSWSDVNYEPSLKDDTARNNAYRKATLANAPTELTNMDALAIRSFRVEKDTVITGILPEYTTLQGTNLSFIVACTSVIAGNPITDVEAFYTVQPLAYDRGDFEARDGITIDIPQIDLDINSKPIVAKTKKLKARWTPEVATDLVKFQNVDAEKELTGVLGEHISLEVDLEILEMLFQAAEYTVYWSARPGFEWNDATKAFERNTSYYVNSKNEWFQTLQSKINKASNFIHKRIIRSGANFAVVSPTISTVIDSMSKYNAVEVQPNMQYSAGVEMVGKLQKTINIYKNPYMSENVIIVGYRGNGFLETGAVYAPYVPIVMTPVVYDPVDFTPRKGIATRFAKTIVRKEFYAKILVGDTDYI